MLVLEAKKHSDFVCGGPPDVWRVKHEAGGKRQILTFLQLRLNRIHIIPELPVQTEYTGGLHLLAG
ncbi:hypothetical protein [Kovacikia minuta]